MTTHYRIYIANSGLFSDSAQKETSQSVEMKKKTGSGKKRERRSRNDKIAGIGR